MEELRGCEEENYSRLVDLQTVEAKGPIGLSEYEYSLVRVISRFSSNNCAKNCDKT